MDEKEVLRGRITDLWNRTSRGDYLNHTGFLSPDLQSYAREILAKEKIPVKSEGKAGSFFFGGFEEADRQVLFFLPAYMSTSDFEHEIRRGEGDVVCIRIQPPGRGFAEPVTHRDYLGSLMHLGITREQIGDIVLMDGAAFVFAMRDIASFICTELTRVRHNTVHVQTVPFAECGGFHPDSHPRNLCLRGSLSEPYQDRPLPEVQTGHDAHGEESETTYHASPRPRDNETDIQQTRN